MEKNLPRQYAISSHDNDLQFLKVYSLKSNLDKKLCFSRDVRDKYHADAPELSDSEVKSKNEELYTSSPGG